MKSTRPKKVPLETQLGLLAMRFRGNRDEKERSAIAASYKDVVHQLIQRKKKWKEMPSFEDMLPDQWMPETFYKYWSLPSPHGRTDSEQPLAINITYPLYLIRDGKVWGLIEGNEERIRVKMMPVFAKKEMAEQYCLERFPNGKVVSIPNANTFAEELKETRDRCALIVFHYEKGEQAIPVDEMARQLAARET